MVIALCIKIIKGRMICYSSTQRKNYETPEYEFTLLSQNTKTLQPILNCNKDCSVLFSLRKKSTLHSKTDLYVVTNIFLTIIYYIYAKNQIKSYFVTLFSKNTIFLCNFSLNLTIQSGSFGYFSSTQRINLA